MGRVVLAIDPSEHSERALDFYINQIRRPDDELLLTHCIEAPYFGAYPMRPEVLKERLEEVKLEAETVQAKFKRILESKQIPYKIVSDFGKHGPGEFVVKTANDNQATMIVMGTRGMGKVRRTVLGSVSDYVVHHAHCPVLVARH